MNKTEEKEQQSKNPGITIASLHGLIASILVLLDT
jgi:hypothetical protein